MPNQYVKSLLPVSLIVLSLKSLKAQEVFPPPTYEQKPRIEAVKAERKIIIDGKLNDLDWMRCPVATNFLQTYPSEKAKASYETFVRILYDDKNIYIGAVCQYGGSKLLVQDLKRDFKYEDNDLFGVLFDPFQNQQNPVPAFYSSPYSTQKDELIYDDRVFDSNWDAVWKSKSFVSDSVWSTEMEIPLASLNYPSDSTTWGINFTRNIRSKYEFTGWSIWPMAYSPGRMSYGGLLINIHPPKSKAKIKLQPYLLVNFSKLSAKNTIIKAQTGGEIKWLLNTYTSLEASINTDFAQADVDRQVVNLNRSSVFFPERRQFFLDNANLFSVGQNGIVQPFFSRRIGLDYNGNSLRINGGLRLVHQTAKQALGVIVINQSDKDTSTHTWFGVLRGQKNIGLNNRIGSLITFRYDTKTNVANTVITVDGFIRPSQPLSIRPMMSFSLPDKGSRTGLAFFNHLKYSKNTILFDWYQTLVTKNYNTATGFIARTDFINTRPELTLNFRKHWFNNRVNYFKPLFKADIYHRASDLKFQEANITIAPFWVMFRNSSGFDFGLDTYIQSIETLFRPVPDINIDTGSYTYYRPFIDYYTNQGAKYSAKASLSWGTFYNGNLSSYDITLRMVPIPNIAAGLHLSYNIFSGFATGEKIKTYLITPELRISPNPKLQLTGFYQYNTVAKFGSLNLRFSWEYQPLSFIYLVCDNQKTIEGEINLMPTNDKAGIIKISFVKQL